MVRGSYMFGYRFYSTREQFLNSFYMKLSEDLNLHSKGLRIYFLIIGKMVCLLVLSKLFFSLGYLFMDDLSRAISQFYPSASGGISGGSCPPPPFLIPSRYSF